MTNTHLRFKAAKKTQILVSKSKQEISQTAKNAEEKKSESIIWRISALVIVVALYFEIEWEVTAAIRIEKCRNKCEFAKNKKRSQVDNKSYCLLFQQLFSA